MAVTADYFYAVLPTSRKRNTDTEQITENNAVLDKL